MKRIVFCAFILGQSFLSVALASCLDSQLELLQSIISRESPSTYHERNSASVERTQILNTYAQLAADAFDNNNRLKFVRILKNIDSCVDEVGMKTFNTRLELVVTELSIEKIKKIEGFSGYFFEILSPGHIFLKLGDDSSRRFLGSYDWNNDSIEASIFLNKKETDWLTGLVHELSHKHDPKLQDSISYFQENEVLEKTYACIQKYGIDRPECEIEKFVKHTVYTLILAEVHSELIATAFYIEARKHGLQGRLDRYEDFLTYEKTHHSLVHKIFYEVTRNAKLGENILTKDTSVLALINSSIQYLYQNPEEIELASNLQSWFEKSDLD